MRAFIRAAALGVACAGTAAAQQTRHPACLTNESLRHVRVAGSLDLSPDGRRVVFVVRDGAAEKGASHLWWAETSRPESARQITFSAVPDDAGESSPEWMPDGSAVLFLAHRDKHRQIYRLPANGGEASPLDIEYPLVDSARARGPRDPDASASSGGDRTVDIQDFDVSPDGQWLMIMAGDAQTPAERRKQSEKNDANVVDEDAHPTRVWLYSFAGDSLLPVSPATRSAESASWSHDSRHLAIVTRPPGNADDLGPHHTLEVVDIAAPGASHPIAGAPPTVSSVSWSPDGSWFALSAQTVHDAPPGVSDLFVLPATGGTARDVTEKSGAEVNGDAVWAPDGSAMYLTLHTGTQAQLARLDLATGMAHPIATGFPVSGDFATNAAHTGWAFVGQASDRPPEVEFLPAFDGGGAAVRLSDVNPQWADAAWVSAQPASWKSADGMEIHGLLFVPAASGCDGKARDARFPLIVNVHGGPTGAFSQAFSPFVQWELAQGWAVLEPNPRGSTGYGWQFAAANKNDLGGRDYEDVMTGLDWALAQQPVDSTRLGLYGYSYGGEMAGFVEGRTTRFAAIVSGAPVIDQYSEYGTEGGSWYDRWFFGQPWRRPADAWRQSPLARAGEARTPFLLLQGETDTTDPLGQSQEMYRALRQQGAPVKLVTFPRESHGGLGGGIAGSPSREPWHGFEARQQILDWFVTHFQKR